MAQKTSKAKEAQFRTREPDVDVLLVTVTEVETCAILEALREEFGYDTVLSFVGNNTYYDLGIIGGARTFMVQSDMGAGGPGGSLLTIQEGIETLSPSAVVMVGIAFGVNPKKQHIGDILVSRQILVYELQRVGTGPSGELVIIPRGARPQASPRMLAMFRAGAIDWKEANVVFGLILSGEKLVDNQDFRDQLRRLEPEAIGGEMEGVGLYAAAERSRAKVDWILVKAICDWADGQKHQNKSQRQRKASRNAARFTIQILRHGGVGGSKAEWYEQRDIREWQILRAQMKEEDSILGQQYSDFWNIARKYYIENFRPKDSLDFPETFEGFIRAAGAPPNTVNPENELIAWPIINENRLSLEQLRIWNFAKRIYPTRRLEDNGDVWEHSAIKPVEYAKKFHDSRRTLAKYWDKWTPLVGYGFIHERYETRCEIVLLLAWLDLALVQWTRMGGMHKQELFRLALAFDQSIL